HQTHRADDPERAKGAEPRGDSDETSVSKPLHQVGDEPPRGWVTDAELDDRVAEERRDDAGKEKRKPDRGTRDRACLAEQREDAGADHGTDAEEGAAAGGHATASSWSAPPAPECGRRRRSGRSGCRR